MLGLKAPKANARTRRRPNEQNFETKLESSLSPSPDSIASYFMRILFPSPLASTKHSHPHHRYHCCYCCCCCCHDCCSYWKSLQNLLGSLINSIEAIVSLLVLLFLFLGIFALLGTQVFGGKIPVRKVGVYTRKPRANFDSFSNSLYTVFQVLKEGGTEGAEIPLCSTLPSVGLG